MFFVTVYDLVRVLADQQAGLSECLARLDTAIEDLDQDEITKVNSDLMAIASCMELLSGEVCDRLGPPCEEPEDEIGYGEDELPW